MKLLAWRFKDGMSNRDLLEALTVEGLPYEELPEVLWPAVRGYRKMTQKQRMGFIANWRVQSGFDL